MILGLLLSLYLAIKYGQESFSFELSGPYRVGYRKFVSEDLKLHCSIYYPAKDDGSGKFGAPWLAFGKPELEAMIALAKNEVKSVKMLQMLVPVLLRSWLSIEIPVYQNANLGPKEIQPVIFSHGLKAHR